MKGKGSNTKLRIIIFVLFVTFLMSVTVIWNSNILAFAVDNQPSDAAQKALEYIANRDGIPIEVLQIAEDQPTEYPNLGRKFQVVTLLDTRPDGKVYKLLVDLTDGKIEEDVTALLDAEAQAYLSQYGKFDPALYQRLQEVKDDDVLTVAVWMAAQPGKSLSDLQDAAITMLAAKYPEAHVALELLGRPWDVDDPELASQIEAEYHAFINDEMKARVLPLVTELDEKGFSVTTFDGMPSFTASLPKSLILELGKRDDVGMIYLAEGQEKPALN